MTKHEFTIRIKRIIGKIQEKYGADHSLIFSTDEDRRAALCMTSSGDLYVYNNQMPLAAEHVSNISYVYDSDDEKPCYIMISFFNDDTIFIHLNDDRLTLDFHDDVYLNGPINQVLYEYQKLVNAGEIAFFDTTQNRLQYFISAVESIKKLYFEELVEFAAQYDSGHGMKSLLLSVDTEDYKGDIEVFAGDDLLVYQSANYGILCEGISRSTGTVFQKLTHFDSLDALNDFLENHT